MRIPRIYHPETIHQLGTIALSEDAVAISAEYFA